MIQRICLGAAAVALAAVAAVGVVVGSDLARAVASQSRSAPGCTAVTNSAGTIAAAFVERAERRDWSCAHDLATPRVQFPVNLPRPLRHYHVFYAVGNARRLVVRILLGSSPEIMPAYELELVVVRGRWRVNRFERNA
jgi:hypothetical protein